MQLLLRNEKGDCIEYDSTTSTCTKYRNAECISHITIEGV